LALEQWKVELASGPENQLLLDWSEAQRLIRSGAFAISEQDCQFVFWSFASKVTDSAVDGAEPFNAHFKLKEWSNSRREVIHSITSRPLLLPAGDWSVGFTGAAVDLQHQHEQRLYSVDEVHDLADC
jgi:hypothetical protein